MRLLQLTFDTLKLVEGKPSLIVESQEYGQPSDFLFHVVVNNETAEELIKNPAVREITDNGRTVGFWQRLGGRGILSPNLVAIHGYSEKLIRILSKAEPAKINFEGKTWNEIINAMPEGMIDKTALEVPATQTISQAKSGKAGKKNRRNKKS